MTTEEIKQLEKIAKQNDGRCDQCHQIIRIYKYPANKTLAYLLRKMADVSLNQEGRNFDINDVTTEHKLQSQISKLRFHALIAKVKGADGKHIPRMWVITTKGWAWLRGEAITKYAVVYDNTVQGHEGAQVTINQVERGHDFVQENLTTKEAGALASKTEPRFNMQIRAVYRGYSHTGQGPQKGKEYQLEIERLQVGKPVRMFSPFERTYNDIAAFHKDWQAV